LCHDIPAAREANQVADICRRLRARESLSTFLGESPNLGDHFTQIVAMGYDPPETPPFDFAVFEAKVASVMKSFSDGDVIHWFKHGRGRIDDNAATTLAPSGAGDACRRLEACVSPGLRRVPAVCAQEARQTPGKRRRHRLRQGRCRVVVDSTASMLEPVDHVPIAERLHNTCHLGFEDGKVRREAFPEGHSPLPRFA